MRSFVAGLLLCLFLTSVGVSAAESDTDREAERLYKSAYAMQVTKGDAEKCLTIYKQVISQYPNAKRVRWAQMRAASCLCQLGKYEEAITICDQVIERNTGALVAGWALYWKMLSLIELKRYSDAAAEAWKLDQYVSYTDRGPAYRERREIGKVFCNLEKEAGFEAALAKFPARRDNPKWMAWIYTIRVFAKADTREFAEAETYFNELRQHYPEAKERAAEAAEEISNCMLEYYSSTEEPGDCSKLLYFLSIPKRISPASKLVVAKSEARLALYYMNVKKDSQAAQHVLEAALQTPVPGEITNEMRYYLGQSLLNQRKYREAAGVYAAICSKPTSGFAEAAAYMQGKSLLEVGDLNAAKTVLKSTADSDDVKPEWRTLARRKLVQAYISSGDKVEATTVLQ